MYEFNLVWLECWWQHTEYVGWKVHLFCDKNLKNNLHVLNQLLWDTATFLFQQNETVKEVRLTTYNNTKVGLIIFWFVGIRIYKEELFWQDIDPNNQLNWLINMDKTLFSLDKGSGQ